MRYIIRSSVDANLVAASVADCPYYTQQQVEAPDDVCTCRVVTQLPCVTTPQTIDTQDERSSISDRRPTKEASMTGTLPPPRTRIMSLHS